MFKLLHKKELSFSIFFKLLNNFCNIEGTGFCSFDRLSLGNHLGMGLFVEYFLITLFLLWEFFSLNFLSLM